MKVTYANICGGFIFAGQEYGEMLFKKVDLRAYADYFAENNPDILCLSEVHMENEWHSSQMDYLARRLGRLSNYATVSLGESILDTSLRIGMGVMSNYPIVSNNSFIIPSPGIQVVRPDGEHWTMHDKGGQRTTIDINNQLVDIINFSYFPFHHFNRRVDEPEFSGLRQQLLDILVANKGARPTIVTGDFNNKYVPLPKAFPELFEKNTLQLAVNVPTTVVGSSHQLDYILHTSHFFSCNPQAEQTLSDHYAISTDLRLKQAVI